VIVGSTNEARRLTQKRQYGCSREMFGFIGNFSKIPTLNIAILLCLSVAFNHVTDCYNSGVNIMMALTGTQ
jgi:hypothetical protein